MNTQNTHNITDFRHTTTGPVARIDGVWHSVNGLHSVSEIRYPLSQREIDALQLDEGRTPDPTVEVHKSANYWNASVEVHNGYLNLTAYPSHDGTIDAYHWSADGEYDDVPLPQFERSCEQTWQQWFAWFDEQWPKHELRWAFKALSEAFPD